MNLLIDAESVEVATEKGASLYLTVVSKPGRPFSFELTSNEAGEGANARAVYDLLLEATPSGLVEVILLLADEKRWLATDEELGSFVRALLPLMAAVRRTF